MYNDLSPIWKEAFNEAWKAFCSGTIPIGAIIADRDGNILSRGRNAIFSSPALNPQLLHAEMNCLMNLDTGKYPNLKEYFLYTTMEPCPMCMGTIIMTHIRHVRYAAHDDYCGAVSFIYKDRYMSGKKMDIIFDNNGFEAVQLTLQTVFEFIRNNRKITQNEKKDLKKSEIIRITADSPVITAFRKRCPESFSAAVSLYTDGCLEECVVNNTAPAHVYDKITEVCNSISAQQAGTSSIVPKNQKCKKIILVQHTESEHHINGMIGAWTNWNLTEHGHEQAILTGKWLLENEFKNSKPDIIFCSTLNRTRQTAEEILKCIDAPITYLDSIREVNAGMAHGKSCEWNRQNRAAHPDHYDADYRPFPDAESDRELWNRIYPFYQQLQNSDAENILVVSHGCTLSFLQCMLMGHSDVTIRAVFAPHGPAGSISKFTIEESGRMSMAYLNKTAF